MSKYKKKYRSTLDNLGLTQEQASKIVAEANFVNIFVYFLLTDLWLRLRFQGYQNKFLISVLKSLTEKL